MHHRHMTGYRADKVEDPRVARDERRMCQRLPGNRYRQTFHHERVRIILWIDESEAECVTLTNRYRTGHELVYLLSLEHAALGEVPVEKRIGSRELSCEEWHRSDYYFAATS